MTENMSFEAVLQRFINDILYRCFKSYIIKLPTNFHQIQLQHNAVMYHCAVFELTTRPVVPDG